MTAAMPVADVRTGPLMANLADGRLLPPTLRDASWHEHRRVHGDLPRRLTPAQLIAEVAASGLTGRGGARFPVARKLSAVAGAGRRAVVVANGAEGEPSSRKDRTLLTRSPHLVLDGLAVAAAAVGATRAIIYLPKGPMATQVSQAVAERTAADRLRVDVVAAPETFISGQESAVVSRINGGPAVPTSMPPRVSVKGVDGHPTLVHNVESLAHLALIARHGAEWFRQCGTTDEPGTMLATVSGDVTTPRVVEAPIGTPLRDVLSAAGGPRGELRGVLVGGYHGAWLGADDAVVAELSSASLGRFGASPGAGVVMALGDRDCPLAVSSMVVDYLARQSARQCGPCVNGLPTLAVTMEQLAGRWWSPTLAARVEQLAGLLVGRGACHHPEGTVRLVRSVLAVFPDELAAHAHGRCLADGGAS
jgi:NADH:ubiquinone oxidoreductase subunit F (NADH-binding)